MLCLKVFSSYYHFLNDLSMVHPTLSTLILTTHSLSQRQFCSGDINYLGSSPLGFDVCYLFSLTCPFYLLLKHSFLYSSKPFFFLLKCSADLIASPQSSSLYFCFHGAHWPSVVKNNVTLELFEVSWLMLGRGYPSLWGLATHNALGHWCPVVLYGMNEYANKVHGWSRMKQKGWKCHTSLRIHWPGDFLYLEFRFSPSLSLKKIQQVLKAVVFPKAI